DRPMFRPTAIRKNTVAGPGCATGLGAEAPPTRALAQSLRLSNHQIAKPAAPNRSSVPGSGTSPLIENTALNVGAFPPAGGGPTISVPTRYQSGSRSALRSQLCRSVEPGGNAVPGATIGFGADSQKN